MPPTADDVTLGEVARGLSRLEAAITSLAQDVGARLEGFESRVVKTERFDFEMQRWEERFRSSEKLINERFRSVEADIDANARAQRHQVEERQDRKRMLLASGVFPAMAMFAAGAAVAVITVLLGGVIG